MINQLRKLKRLDFNLINHNLERICKYILENIHLEDMGYRMIKGNGFARIIKPNKSFIPSRGFLIKKSESEIKLNAASKEKNIYISKNRLIFPSIFNIDNCINLKK